MRAPQSPQCALATPSSPRWRCSLGTLGAPDRREGAAPGARSRSPPARSPTRTPRRGSPPAAGRWRSRRTGRGRAAGRSRSRSPSSVPTRRARSPTRSSSSPAARARRSATSSRSLAPAFGRITRARDLVLVDQRGTGGSGRLACPSLDAPERVLEDPAQEVAAVAACARSLEGRPRPLRHRRLRRRSRGGPGGARLRAGERRRLQLRHARRPLLGAQPIPRGSGRWSSTASRRSSSPSAAAFEEDGQRALDLLFARCAADPACASSFPAPAGDAPGAFRPAGQARRARQDASPASPGRRSRPPSASISSARW